MRVMELDINTANLVSVGVCMCSTQLFSVLEILTSLRVPFGPAARQFVFIKWEGHPRPMDGVAG